MFHERIFNSLSISHQFAFPFNTFDRKIPTLAINNVMEMMKASFLDSRGRGGKKNKSKDSGSSPSIDVSAAKEVVLPSVVDKNVEKEKQSSLADTTGLGSYPSLPMQETTTAGNAPDVELKDNIVAAMPKLLGRATILVIFVLSMSGNLLDASQTPKGISVRRKVGFKPTKQVYQPVSKEPTSNTSVNKKKNIEPTKEVSKLLEKVASSCDYDSEDEVVLVDNEMASFLAKNDGYGQDILDKLQAICDKLNITVKGRRKK
nr:hypothetical protein [Tanacetum cinerariifolium]